MKFLKNLFLFGTVVLAMVLGAQAAGPIGALAGGSLAYTGLQAAGIVEMPEVALFATFSIGNIKRRERQEDNMGGFLKMLFILPEDFTAHWPLKTQIENLKVITAPTVTSGKTWATMAFDLDGGGMKFSRKGEINNSNYTHEGTFTLSGVTNEQLVELDKTKGGALIIGVDQEGKRWLAGSTRRPVKVEFDGDLGSKPDDLRKVSGKFSRDGFAFPLLELEDDVTLALTTFTGLD